MTFLTSLANHPKLSLKHGLQLIDFLGKVYMNDMIFARACGVPFTFIASKFIEE